MPLSLHHHRQQRHALVTPSSSTATACPCHSIIIVSSSMPLSLHHHRQQQQQQVLVPSTVPQCWRVVWWTPAGPLAQQAAFSEPVIPAFLLIIQFIINSSPDRQTLSQLYLTLTASHAHTGHATATLTPECWEACVGTVWGPGWLARTDKSEQATTDNPSSSLTSQATHSTLYGPPPNPGSGHHHHHAHCPVICHLGSPRPQPWP